MIGPIAKHLCASVLVSTVGLTASCSAEPGESLEASARLEILAETETFEMESAVTGRTYQIFVALPRLYDEASEPLPVVYSVDANGQFGTVVDVVRMMPYDGYPEPIVVGIGYPVGRNWNAERPRAVDLTPTADQEAVERFALEYPQFPAMEGSGGGPDFLRFMVEELFPRIEASYTASPEGRTLYGHSFGGLFGTYALFRGDGAFERFVIGSPSYWWDGGSSFELEAQYAETHDSLPARVFFSVGMLEEPPGDEELAEYAMVGNLRDFLDILEGRGYAGLTYTSEFFPDETHTSVIPATVSRGLRYVFESDVR